MATPPFHPTFASLTAEDIKRMYDEGLLDLETTERLLNIRITPRTSSHERAGYRPTDRSIVVDRLMAKTLAGRKAIEEGEAAERDEEDKLNKVPKRVIEL